MQLTFYGLTSQESMAHSCGIRAISDDFSDASPSVVVVANLGWRIRIDIHQKFPHRNRSSCN